MMITGGNDGNKIVIENIDENESHNYFHNDSRNSDN